MKRFRSAPSLVENLEGRVLLATDFTVVALSDTQYMVDSSASAFATSGFMQQTAWIADNAAAGKIAFVAVQGDMLRRGYSTDQIDNAQTALDQLGSIPSLVSIGNHDFDNQFDDLDHHISSASFTGAFRQGMADTSSLDLRNSYKILHAVGANGAPQDYMVLSIEWEAEDSAIAWAQGVINAHRNLPVILATHEYLNSSGRTTSPLDPAGNAGNAIFQKLVYPNPQIFLVLSGHTGAVNHQSSTNSAGSVVYETVGDFEGSNYGRDGYTQLFQFDTANNVINVSTYSPVLGVYDTSMSRQFSLPINFATRFNFANGVVANDDVCAIPPGTTFSGNVITNDSGGQTAALVLQRVKNKWLPPDVNGTLAFNDDGSFTYTPDAGFRGTATFSYTLSSGNVSSTATVYLNVNAAPAAAPDSAAALQGVPVTVDTAVNDTDADGNALRPILRSLPARGAVFANADGTLTYAPDPKFTGTDTFTYVATDGLAVSNLVSVTISVTALVPSHLHYDYPTGVTVSTGSASTTDVGGLSASNDGLEQVITEAGGSLYAVWAFSVAGVANATDVAFCINAKRNLDDEYHLQYSTNASTWYDMTQFVPASSRDVTRLEYSADEPYQMWALPASTAGAVYVRAYDTKSNSDNAALTVDEMFIRSINRVVPDTEAPTAPTNLIASAVTSDSVALAWTASTDNVGVAGYEIYRDGAIVGTTSGTSYTDGGLMPESPHNYWVVARDDAGNSSAPSSTLSVTTQAVSTAPAAPTNLSASYNKRTDKITLHWTDNSSDEDGFLIWYSPDNGSTWTYWAGAGANSTSYIGSLPSGSYLFKVRSYVSDGSSKIESADSNYASVRVR